MSYFAGGGWRTPTSTLAQATTTTNPVSASRQGSIDESVAAGITERKPLVRSQADPYARGLQRSPSQTSLSSNISTPDDDDAGRRFTFRGVARALPYFLRPAAAAISVVAEEAERTAISVSPPSQSVLDSQINAPMKPSTLSPEATTSAEEEVKEDSPSASGPPEEEVKKESTSALVEEEVKKESTSTFLEEEVKKDSASPPPEEQSEDVGNEERQESRGRRSTGSSDPSTIVTEEPQTVSQGADDELSEAKRKLNDFAEQYPTTQRRVHELESENKEKEAQSIAAGIAERKPLVRSQADPYARGLQRNPSQTSLSSNIPTPDDDDAGRRFTFRGVARALPYFLRPAAAAISVVAEEAERTAISVSPPSQSVLDSQINAPVKPSTLSPEATTSAEEEVKEDSPSASGPPEEEVKKESTSTFLEEEVKKDSASPPPEEQSENVGNEERQGSRGRRSTGSSDTSTQDSPDDAERTVWDLLNVILNKKVAYKTLLGSKGQRAQAVLDVLQKSLDSANIPENLRVSVLFATIRLCRLSGVYPQCLALREIRYDKEPIASGSFGEIWKGYLGTRTICLKVPRVYARSEVENVIKSYAGEAILWGQLNHPNLLPFYGIYPLDGRFSRVGLVSPWMQNGNVTEYLKANPEAPCVPLVHDILAGLGYLHELRIVHGDLKGANILISPNGSACIADFGLSSVVGPDILRWTSLGTISKTGGTVRWEAPELMGELEDDTSPRPTFQTDVYSVASVTYEVLTGQIPYYEFPRDATVMFRTLKGIRPTRPRSGLALELSDEIWNVMGDCWNADPSKRPTVKQVAEQLREIPQSESTARRIAQHHLHKQKARDTEGRVLPSRLFREAIRGHHLIFSKADVDLLREFQN